jgi:hypothetical protein
MTRAASASHAESGSLVDDGTRLPQQGRMSACLPLPGRRCGLHVVVASSPAARVTRCACGTVHVHFARPRMTLTMHMEELRHLGNALSAAARMIDAAEAPQVEEAPAPVEPRARGPLH